MDKMLEGTVDENTYKTKNAELNHLIAEAKTRYQEATGKEWDIETALNLACMKATEATGTYK